MKLNSLEGKKYDKFNYADGLVDGATSLIAVVSNRNTGF